MAMLVCFTMAMKPLVLKHNPQENLTSKEIPSGTMFRHIYNNSNQPWTFLSATGRGKAGLKIGNVWFLNQTCAQDSNNRGRACNGPWTVPPHCSVEIQYTTSKGACEGGWYITDAHNAIRMWNYDNGMSIYNAPYISHSGDTGSVSLNDSANGDMSVGSDFW